MNDGETVISTNLAPLADTSDVIPGFARNIIVVSTGK
jgi:hypothetical protein